MLIKSVDRAMDILLLLHERAREMGVTEIAEELDIYKSTVYRSLYTLEQKGFVMQNPSNELYSIGIKFFALGLSMQNRLPILEILKPYAKALHDEFNEVVNISVLDMTDPNRPLSLMIHKEVGSGQMLIPNPPVGSISSCYSSSVGKCLLAYSDVDYSVLRQDELKCYTKNTITDWDLLIEKILEVRETGYAIDDEELEIGLTCIGAPIVDRNKKIIAAISISGPTQRMRSDDFERKVQRVKETAEMISRKFQ